MAVHGGEIECENILRDVITCEGLEIIYVTYLAFWYSQESTIGINY